jgi:hypothetical protein
VTDLVGNGSLLHVVKNGRLFAWDRSQNRSLEVGAGLALDPEREFVKFAARYRARLLALIGTHGGDRLMLSADLGKSWRPASPPPGATVTALAASDRGFVAGTDQGVWEAR